MPKEEQLEPIAYAELHSAIRLPAEKGIEKTLNPTKYPALLMNYEPSKQRLWIEIAGKKKWIPLSNIASITPQDERP